MYTINRSKVEHAGIFGNNNTQDRSLHCKLKYKTLYGLSLFQIYILTSYLKNEKHPPDYVNFSVKHVLWVLYYLKNYPLRVAAARTLGVSEKTFDKYVWYGIKLISEIHNVSNDSRLKSSILILTSLIFSYIDTIYR